MSGFIGDYEVMRQTAMIKYATEERGSVPWTVLYRSWRDERANGAEFAALAPTSLREQVLRDSSWELSIGDGAPGFMQSYEDGEPTTVYLRHGGHVEGVEPIVLIQNHHGIKNEMLPQLSEEFRLYHNLWANATGTTLIKVKDDGTEEIVAEISPSLVRVRTSYLKQFQAARQLDLLLFLDSVEYFPELPDPPEHMREDLQGDDYYFFLGSGTAFTKDGPFSRLNGKRVLPPPPIERSGIWPFEDPDDEYPEFIVGEDDHGVAVRFSCDPDQLANYFGANPDAPHYLTPVFFRREVLQRYYEDTDRYSVEDGYLRCGGLWGCQIDNNHPEQVMVFLGDLGRDLPAIERSYWKTFNLAPTDKMSRTAFSRSFLAIGADPEAIDLRFKSAYARFNRTFEAAHGWRLFKELHEADEHVLLRLRVPLNESQSEFEDQILGLTKLLVDALDEKAIVKEAGKGDADEKGLGKFDRWLEMHGYPQRERDMVFLRRLQRLRSKITAHRKSKDYEEVLRNEGVNASLSQEMREQLESATAMIDDLAAHFGVEGSRSE